MRKGKVRAFFRILFYIIIILVIVLWVTGNNYVYKTLLYNYPGIDDLDIFDSRKVEVGVPQPWSVSTEINSAELPGDLQQEIKKTETVAFLVIRNDSIVYEKYFDEYDKDSVSNSFSAAKSIVGIMTGIAVGDGLINVDDPVGMYLPEFNAGDNKKLLIRHLLTMSSGLNWDESYSSLFSPTTKAYYGKELEDLVLDLKVVEEPGKVFRYMSCNSVLLGLIVSRVSGMSLADFAAQRLWKKIGAEDPAYWSLDHENGIEKSYCCFYSNARDFARIGKLYLDSGKWNGQVIVPQDYFLASVTPADIVDPNGTQNTWYGYQWWLMNSSAGPVYYARGILGQYIIDIPSRNMIIVRLGRMRGEKTPGNHYTDMVAYMEGVLKVF